MTCLHITKVGCILQLPKFTYELFLNENSIIADKPFVCLGPTVAWSRSRQKRMGTGAELSAYRHCRLSRRVKGLSRDWPALHPVDFQSSEILLPSGDGLLQAPGC